MAGSRVIFHIDMNCFFASCEVAKDPSLKGKKVAVAHMSLDKKGMVLAQTYEARACGIKTTMKVYEAEKLCKDIIFVEPKHELYQEYSRKFFDYLAKITPLLEPASIDEGYLDVTDCCGVNQYVDLAKTIQQDLLTLFDLPCSIGIAPNKLLAKMASDMHKPLGITVLRKRDIDKLMWPLPIEDLFGAGKKTCETLHLLKIETIGDLANYQDINLLKKVLGENSAQSLLASANGVGDNVVDASRYAEVSSISNSHTLDRDEYDYAKIVLLMKLLSNSVSRRLEQAKLKAKTFTLQLKYSNFKMVSKSITVLSSTNDSYEMIEIYRGLLDEIYNPNMPIRLVGTSASKVTKVNEEVKRFTIFDCLDEEQKDLEVSKVIKDINKMVGSDLLKKGI